MWSQRGMRKGRSRTTNSPWSLLLLGATLSACCVTVRAEFKDLDIVLDPHEVTDVHGAIRAPGSVDLSNLRFAVVHDGNQDPSDKNATILLDVAVFEIPLDCRFREGCDWPSLGVGAVSEKEGASSQQALTFLCCTQHALDLGLCSEKGRLILDENLFQGRHWSKNVRSSVPQAGPLKDGLIEVDETGDLAVLFANCHTDAYKVSIGGTAVYKSKHGYLPGDLIGYLVFYIVLTILYASLLSIYGCQMRRHPTTLVEKVICACIATGLTQTLLNLADLAVWNQSGRQSSWIPYLALAAGALKQTWAVVMVAVVSLGRGKAHLVAFLGGLYILFYTVRAVADALSLRKLNEASYESANRWFITADAFSVGILLLDITIVVGVQIIVRRAVVALRATQAKNQDKMIRRYRRFALLLWSVLSCTLGVFIGGLISIVPSARLVNAASSVNYFCVITGVASLWWPSSTTLQEQEDIISLTLTASRSREEDVPPTYRDACSQDDNDEEGTPLHNVVL